MSQRFVTQLTLELFISFMLVLAKTETINLTTKVPSTLINNNLNNEPGYSPTTSTISQQDPSDFLMLTSHDSETIPTTSITTAQVQQEATVANIDPITEQPFDDVSETISFGIRSFTVEVSTSEKLSTTTVQAETKQTASNSSQIETSETPGQSLSTAIPISKSFMANGNAELTSSDASTMTTTTMQLSENEPHSEDPTSNVATHFTPTFYKENVLKSNLNILFNDDEAETTAFDEIKYNRADATENEISNEIQIDKRLDNGLYRIKIGEITTDEFNNGLNFNEPDEGRDGHKDKLPSVQHHQKQQPKVNIDDFFPSKIEDFKPIIEISNEKLLREKDALHNEQVKPEFTMNGEINVDVKGSTRINTSNFATTNIEIELIDDSLNGPVGNQNNKEIHIDGILTRVEETPILDESPPANTKINTDNLYIPRRTKKFDPLMKSNVQGPTRIHDFGMTKFNLEQNKSENAVQSVNGKPQFSTTKFYNSKELYNEILHKDPKASSTVQVAVKPTNIIREKLLASNRIPIETSHLATIIPSNPTFSTPITTALLITSTTTFASTTNRPVDIPTSHPRVLSRLEEKLNSLDCEIQNLSADSTVWRGNETHELNLPITTPEDCSSGTDCLPMIITWEGSADIQSGDVLIVEIDDKLLIPPERKNKSDDETVHHNTAAVYQVTRLGHEHCDITEGELLDITPLVVDGKKLVTLYDKDLTEGINLLIVVSELWDQQCVRLRVNVKSDNCGENAECSGKGICFSNASMEGYECECCTGFAGPHCEEIDACTPSPCTNNGICVDLSQGHEGNSYQCLCPYGYTGKNCQSEADPCNPSNCLNGATCISNSTQFRIANSTFPFRCECPSGFTGPLCQHNLNECGSSPCVHGICVDQEDGFRCFCENGFSGDLCNFEYNECDSNPCVNGAQCIDHVGGFSCQCTKGYQGKRCHIKIDFCANNPCEDGYRCVDHGDEYSCVCPGSNDHMVPDCHDVPRTLCTVNPCGNGGTCWTSDESFYCACRPGFTGKMCEDDFVIDTVVSSSELLSDISDSNNVITFDDTHEGFQDDGTSDLHNAYVAVGILISALIVLAVVITICHCKVNGNYRRFSVNHRQLIPIFGRKSKNASSEDERSKHWLSGKNSSFFEENHINLKNSQQPQHSHCTSSSLFNRPLQMNLENDMYYTAVDFSESQQSPLIQ